ncbi:conserved protein of unknown function [Pseudodesulfovibrio profundus]|uniref:Uncharacterized protein n=1 Tax=Pseudodesulfovibrio profundus TaxID=57320 RepID=A0A2C8FDD6_9BACT|nr:hypothetical protein [Pseudodesulfovibrio profundus]SOB60550.1 conserved protein of unknown function [Pseudodesulfovibrio profundus]
MTPEDARHRLYLISYALEELSRVTEDSKDATLSSTLDILAISMGEAMGVVHPHIPDSPHHSKTNRRR